MPVARRRERLEPDRFGEFRPIIDPNLVKASVLLLDVFAEQL